MNSEHVAKIEKLISKIKNDKKALLIILLGMLGMILILFSGDEKKDEINISESRIISETETEKELQDLLSRIEGAGKVSVMITYESTQEDIFAKDSDAKVKDRENTVKEEYIIIEDGNKETGLKIKTVYPKVKGVAVVCEGASNAVIKEQIVSVVSALFDIGTNHISVVNMR